MEVKLKSKTSYNFSECEEYKNIIRTVQCVGMNLWRNPCPQQIVEYECHTVGQTGLIVGGEQATAGEFPHMAGKTFKPAFF